MVKVFRTRTTNIDVSLADRVNRANTAKVGLFYSLHVNGSIHATARGFDSHIYTSPSDASKKAQDIIQKHIAPVFLRRGSLNRGKRQNNFFVVRETRMPAVLTENGFMSNAEDMALWKQAAFVDDLARAHAAAINEIAAVLDIDSIWLDEGHGGSAPGAVSADGTREADLVLNLSNQIVKFLAPVEPVLPPEIEQLRKALQLSEAQRDTIQKQLSAANIENQNMAGILRQVANLNSQVSALTSNYK